MDKGTSRKLMLQYIREYTNKGQLIDASKTADYSNGHDFLLDSVQKEIALQIKIPAVFQVTQYDEKDERYTGIFEYAMPSDFYLLDSIILKRSAKSYEQYTNYKWENNKRVVLGDDVGTFDIHYFKYPATIAADAPDNTELELEEKGALLVPLKLAGRVVKEDKPDISADLLNEFSIQLANISNTLNQGPRKIESIYYMG